MIGYSITLDTIRVVLRPADERMRSIISLKALGIKEEQAVCYYLAMVMAERGVISAPNMAMGSPFNIGGNAQTSLSVEPPVLVPNSA